MEETYAPVVLINKASELRRRTKNWGIHAKQEEIEVDFKELIIRNISRPMRILFTEPIVLLITIYMSFICKFTTYRVTSGPDFRQMASSTSSSQPTHWSSKACTAGVLVSPAWHISAS